MQATMLDSTMLDSTVSGILQELFFGFIFGSLILMSSYKCGRNEKRDQQTIGRVFFRYTGETGDPLSLLSFRSSAGFSSGFSSGCGVGGGSNSTSTRLCSQSPSMRLTPNDHPFANAFSNERNKIYMMLTMNPPMMIDPRTPSSRCSKLMTTATINVIATVTTIHRCDMHSPSLGIRSMSGTMIRRKAMRAMAIHVAM